ncbi:MAG: SDR family NAD(P)-dependent oxidoreductase [Opitutaceae bacterium]|jgi:phthiocerol/phenolphthiocerol synthesis type-I polyketide synthase E|nr:SDR family NAD(P)-dependent oxidoreductase [Opitutaceae bacterium]
MSQEKIDDQAVAVTAVAGRFPGAPDVETFWANLCGGVESIHFFSDDELRTAGVSQDQLSDRNYVKARPRLADVDQFDAAYFGIPPREAEVMDPQHRLFLEVAHEALERAGISADQFDGLVGVFGASSTSSYLLQNLQGHPGAATAGAVLGTGNFSDFLTSRVSYKLNLGGPAYSLQTACSGSLVAVHVAVQSLLNFECDAALAGGAAVSLPQESGYMYQEDGVMSPDGHCRPFSANARGTVFGSGVGVVTLRRLVDAVKDGDRILAVIKGSAINNDGAVKAGFTAPAVRGQADVIGEALANAGVSADDISYVEGHGTATPLGDPIEVTALTQAFRESSARTGYCALGSVKSNIGHLDAAGGIAGFIKTVLALHHRELPATLHFEEANPKIDFAGSPFRVQAEHSIWAAPAEGGPRRAGVSAFGVGGTNAHVILEEAPAAAPVVGPTRKHELLVISARTEAALQTATEALTKTLSAEPDLPLGAVAQSLREGRRAWEHRRVVVATDTAAAVEALAKLDPTRVATGEVEAGTREVAFLFPGQGAQTIDMGRELYATEPVFRAALDECVSLFQAQLEIDLLVVMYPPEGADRAEVEARLRRTELAQPALFAVEYALAQQWQAWGIKPAVMLGHSLGEVTAGCVAGVFSLADAVRMVAARGRLMQALPEGAMLAVTLAPADVKPYLTTTLSLAIVNGPRACVVAGPSDEIAALEDTLREAGVMARQLPTSHAFQSQLMEPMVEPFLAEMRNVKLTVPAIPFISNVTGRRITAEEATDPRYWARQLRQTVYFADGLKELATEPNRVFIEVGPGRILAGLTRPNLAAGDARSVWASLPDARERKSDEVTLLNTLGRLWIAGVPGSWKRFRGEGAVVRVPLPTYPFERQRFWLDPERGEVTGQALSRAPLDDWFYAPVWKQSTARVSGSSIEGTWIVTADSAGVGAALASTWRTAGRRVLEREPGAQWEEILQAAADSGGIAGVVTTTFLTSGGVVAATDAFHDGIGLAPALVAGGWVEPLRVILATRAGQGVLASDAVEPASALATGLAEVLPKELPFLKVRQVDLASDASEAATVEALAAEAELAGAEPLAAWRGGGRWVPHFERLSMPTPELDGIRAAGVYVITGGFGGMGLALADALAETTGVRLVLVGRRGGTGKGKVIAALEAKGAEVLPLALDVSSTKAWQDIFAAAEERWGAVHGVIHAAGVAGRTIAVRKTREETATVWAPKVGGGAGLAEASDGRSFDFVLLCSSLAVWAGSAGQSDYVAANAFLDAQAEALVRHGVPAMAVNWDLWRDIGMGAAEAQGTDWAISGSEGAEVLRRLLARPRAKVLVSTAALPDRFRAQEANDRAETRTVAQRYPRPALRTPFTAPAAGVEADLAEQWAEVLGLEQVGAEDNFFELGGDSLSALQAIAAIKRRTGTVLAVAAFYDAPTPRLLGPVVAELTSRPL